jgi:hypothetical protein
MEHYVGLDESLKQTANPFHHLSGDSHLHPLLGARPITASRITCSSRQTVLTQKN